MASCRSIAARGTACVCLCAALTVSLGARAQGAAPAVPPAPSGPSRPGVGGVGGVGEGSLDPGRLVVDEDLTAKQAGTEARARAQRGDCKGALDGFDAALRTSADPTLHRDRGLCHEKLGHPFPARDDFRDYLTARPEAFDADTIRQHLESLEGTSSESDEPKGSRSRVEARASVSVAGEASADTRTIDKVEADEDRRIAADGSPLRRGSGFIIGPYFGVQRWGKEELGWGETFGAALRYAPGRVGTLITEIGYSTINASGTDSAYGGLSLFAGYEVRIGLDEDVTNAFLLAAGLGYERLKRGATGFVDSIVLPRGRVGFRHVFGPSLGLEWTADAGPAFTHIVDSNTSVTTFFVGGTMALVVGF